MIPPFRKPCPHLLFILLATTTSYTSYASDLKPRGEVNWRASSDRSILMTNLWVPLQQTDTDVLFTDIRLMGDNNDNREGNIGLGYRTLSTQPLLGKGIWGGYGWIDRRSTKLGSFFNQVTLGTEWLKEDSDLRLNVYIPLSDEKSHTTQNTGNSTPYFAGTGLVVDTTGTTLEEPQRGFDIEFGHKIPFIADKADDARFYMGAYYFKGDVTPDVAGWRTRATIDITPDFQIGARFQKDDERGSQGFLEATVRFPFNQKKSIKTSGLHGRMDESPERDIDIVTGQKVTNTGLSKPVINTTTGTAQEILHVDNTAAGGGDGSAEHPFNTLAAASVASNPHGIIYVHYGDGTSAGQDAGIVLNKTGQQLIGSGTNFVWDENKFSVQGANRSLTSIIISSATTAPVISSSGPLQDILIQASDVTVAGIKVSDPSLFNYNIYILNTSGTTYENIRIADTIIDGGSYGIYAVSTNVGSIIDGLDIDNVDISDESRGIYLRTLSNGKIQNTAINDTSSHNNTSHGIYIQPGSGHIINTSITDSNFNDNGGSGIQLFSSSASASIDDLSINRVSTSGNSSSGLTASVAGTGKILSATIDNSSFTNTSGGPGVHITSITLSTLEMKIQNSTMTGNGFRNLFINNDNGGTPFTLDLGGGTLGSTGGNSIHGATSGFEDLFLDINGETLSAENNWWGSAVGIGGISLDLDDGTIDSTPFLTSAP